MDVVMVLLVVGGVVAVGLALFLLDRVLLAAERRGWIFYRHVKANPTTSANALQSVMQIWDPASIHAAHERQRMDAEAEEDGAPPDPLDDLTHLGRARLPRPPSARGG